MLKEIRYGGQKGRPDGYSCADGDLEFALNVINEDGALRPMGRPSVALTLESDKTLLLIHRVTGQENYIFAGSDGLSWLRRGSDTSSKSAIKIDTGTAFRGIVLINGIQAVGNILVLALPTATHYIRFVGKENRYVYLGTRIPDVSLDAGLRLNFITTTASATSYEMMRSEDDDDDFATPDDSWETLFTDMYDLDTRKGEMNHANYPYESTRDKYIASDFIALSSNPTIKKNVEYKFKLTSGHSGWTTGADSSLVFNLYGYRSGSSKLEMICALTRGSEDIREECRVFDDDWTGIRFKVLVKCIQTDEEIRTDAHFLRITGELSCYKGIDHSASNRDSVPIYFRSTEDNFTALMGQVNKFVKEKFISRSKFIYPFFLRYALRLYDGTYASPSAPVLMVPNSSYAPAICYTYNEVRKLTSMVLSAFGADLVFQAHKAIPPEWEDLVSSVDFFVSPPVWGYNQGLEFDIAKTLFKFKTSVDSFGYGNVYFEGGPANGNTSYGIQPLSTYLKLYSNAVSNCFVEVAPVPSEEIFDKVRNISSFHLVGSVSFKEYNDSVSEFKKLDIEEGALTSLSAREPLRDNVLSYEGFSGASLYVYNNRLNVFDAKANLPSPCHPRACFNYNGSNRGLFTRVYVLLNTDGGKKVVQTEDVGTVWGPWYYYPDGRAYKACFVIYDGDNVEGYAEIDLKRHDYLPGAYWFGDSFEAGVISFVPATVNPYPDLKSDSRISVQNSVYISQVGNPFIFPAESVVTIDCGRILRLSSAAKALSQGQFGQFPLYAFTDDGVWALEMASTGVISARQPITRDVCNNPEGITQIDSAVLFPTARGIMLISGSQTSCISEPVDAPTGLDLSAFPGLRTLFTGLTSLLPGVKVTPSDPSDSTSPRNAQDIPVETAIDGELNPGLPDHSIAGDGLPDVFPSVVAPFGEYLATCRMIYDYPGQRILVFNPSFEYVYVYSLRSQTWSMAHAKLLYGVNAYPDAMAVDYRRRLLDFSSPGSSLPRAVVLSRPLKLDMPDVLKTVSAAIQRGRFSRGDVQSVIYGSRNLEDWHLVWSSKDHFLRGFRGTPYRYFRLAIGCSLGAGESVAGASVQFEPRYTNALR